MSHPALRNGTTRAYNMDLLHELESMAVIQQDKTEPECDEIKRWKSLFGYTYSDAAQKIQDHRSNFARVQLSELHWDMVREEKESQGYDKESYDTQTKKKKKKKSDTYLLKLERPFSSPGDVQMVCGASSMLPLRFSGTDDDGAAASFCKVDEATMKILLNHLSAIGSTFQPIFIRYAKAEKNLSATSIHPTLGSEATLPHQRPSTESDIKFDQRLLPAQDQYPVWYFFYGTLADPTVLNNLLGIEPVYRAAKVRGGRLVTWGGKYKALVDAPAYNKDCVYGHAFLVKNKDQEDALQLYETDNYEVVRSQENENSSPRNMSGGKAHAPGAQERGGLGGGHKTPKTVSC
ncbi:hypothetical protein CFIO01_00785 [Colletotrichum fioriniae PJ7]|uniref:Putative gamma-glutamylcyclotransferase n=1 Tax=Colletotrichum fioriniae PJ7 TaxID=1445577 RepID=A0A010SFT1_9PEZI|nr:hypothetical protein CFIO01_00785 [Colletotrichum fioriniae PJ7]